MLEFIEHNNATDEGRKQAPAAKVLGRMVLNGLYDILHWLVCAPAQRIVLANGVSSTTAA
jgi:hypothetical protein